MTLFAGVDGCRAGWCVALWAPRIPWVEVLVVPDFATVLDLTRGAKAVGVDMPIGLLDEARRGGRPCDIAARAFLGSGRASSIFAPPVRVCLEAGDYEQALAMNRSSSPDELGISRQAYHLIPKIREIDRAVLPKDQKRVFEIHPEIVFARCGDGRPVGAPKRTPAGRKARLAILGAAGIPEPGKLAARGAAGDDVLDACAACLGARDVHDDAALRFPAGGGAKDARGLRMEIHG